VNDGRGLRRISALGGEAVEITELDRSLGETAHSTPWFLPDGRHFLYTAWSQKPENRAIYVASLDSKSRTRLMTAEGKAIYSRPGYLLFLRERTLMARPFDADRLQFTGDAVPLAEEVGYNPGLGQSAFYVSTQGTLIYYRSRGSVTTFAAGQQLFSMDRTGKPDPLGDAVLSLRISPDGKQVAFGSAGPSDVWIYDIERNLRTRLTTDAAFDGFPIWSPDGARLVFASDRGNEGTGTGVTALYEKPSNGSLLERLVLRSEAGMRVVPRDWSSDGQYIVFEKSKTPGANPRDLWVLPLSGDRKPVPYLTTAFDESQPALSPNGRWLAYVSNESGTDQIVVQPFPDPAGGKWQISTSGGVSPRWKRDGRELYYLDRDRRMVAVAVTTDGKFELGRAVSLFETPLLFPPPGLATNIPFDVTADGQRFLMSGPLGLAALTNATPITVVVNWGAALKK
jgi:Tol biopolymer transport system component